MSSSPAPAAASPFGLRWAAAAVAGGCVLWRAASFGVLDNDHFIHLARAHQILHGAWPLRDFSDPGLPGQYLLSALAAWIWGATPATDAGLHIAMLAVAAALTLRLAHRATGSLTVAAAVAVAQIIAMPRLYAAPKVLVYVVAIAGAWRYLDGPTARRAAALGVWTAVAFLMRHDHGIYVSVAVVAAVVAGGVASGVERGQRRLADIAVAAGAGALVLLPWVAYVWAQVGVAAYLESALAFSGAEAVRTARQWPGMAAVMTSPTLTLQVAALYAAIAMPLVVLLMTRWRHAALTHSHVLVVAVLLALCDLGFLRDQMVERLPDVAGPLSVAVAILLGVGATGRRMTSSRTAMAGGPLTLTLALTLAVVAVTAPRLASGAFAPARFAPRVAAALEGSLRWPWPRTMPTPALFPLVRYVEACTAPSDEVLAGWFAPEFAVYARRPFGGGHPSWQPGYFVTQADQSQIRRWLLARPPRIVLVDGRFERDWPAAMRALTDSGRYAWVSTIRIAERDVRVWVRDVPSNAAPDVHLDLPCVEPQHPS